MRIIPWFKVDDAFHSHPKVMELTTGAVGLWTLAGAWCADYLTDGEIRTGQLRRLGGTEDEAAQLVEAGLWIPTEDGYRFKDWHDYQPTRESVEADKEVSRRRWAMNNNPELRKAVRGRDGSMCRYCGKTVNWSDRRGEGGGTYDHVIPMSAGGDESAENIVVACRECNYSKGARTPDQAGMALLPPRSNLDKTQNAPRESSSTSRPPVPVPDPVPKEEKRVTRAKPKVPFPDDWEPVESHRAKARQLSLDIDMEAQKFKTFHESKDNRYADWGKAFHTWLTRAAEYQQAQSQPRLSAADREMQVAAERHQRIENGQLGQSVSWDDVFTTQQIER